MRRGGCGREIRASLASNSSMSRSLQRAICRYVRDAELVEHALDHGPDADDQLEVVRRAGRIEQRRRRVVLDVDDDLPIARDFGARVGEIAKSVRRSSANARSCGSSASCGEARLGVGSGSASSSLAACRFARSRPAFAAAGASDRVARASSRSSRPRDTRRRCRSRAQSTQASAESVHGAWHGDDARGGQDVRTRPAHCMRRRIAGQRRRRRSSGCWTADC